MACRSCGKLVIWLKNTTTGKASPIDAEPSPNGNCEIIGATYRVLAKDDLAEARESRVELHMNHFATCSHAKTHKKGKT